MSDNERINERIREGLGYEVVSLDESGGWWWKHPTTGEVEFEDALPDYENDDAAAVALLEELARRFPVLNLGVHHCSEQSAPRWRWALADWYSTGEPIGEGHTPRGAIVNGALALLCGDES